MIRGTKVKWKKKKSKKMIGKGKKGQPLNIIHRKGSREGFH